MIFLLQETETQSYVPFLAHIVKNMKMEFQPKPV